jgi:uncharacterized protein
LAHHCQSAERELIGAWFEVRWATRRSSHTYDRIISLPLVVIAVFMVASRDAAVSGALLADSAQMIAGTVAGFAIGVVAA